MDKYAKALNNISSYEIWHYATYDDDGYCNDDDYTEYPFSDSEDINLLSELITKYDTLNKGIDELLKKYESKLNNLTLVRGIDEKCNIHNAETRAKLDCYCEIIQDLKKLKGSE